MLTILNFTSEDYPSAVYTQVYDLQSGKDLLTTIRDITKKFLETPEGEAVISKKFNNEFTMDDFIQYVPDEMKAESGLIPVEADIHDLEYSTILVSCEDEDDEEPQ